MTTSVATKVSLSDIPPLKWKLSGTRFHLTLNSPETFEWVNRLPTGDKHDETSVNECAKLTSFGDEWLIVVYNGEGKATAVYRAGEKIA